MLSLTKCDVLLSFSDLLTTVYESGEAKTTELNEHDASTENVPTAPLQPPTPMEVEKVPLHSTTLELPTPDYPLSESGESKPTGLSEDEVSKDNVPTISVQSPTLGEVEKAFSFLKDESQETPSNKIA